VALAATLAACGSSSPAAAPTTTSAPATTAPATTTPATTATTAAKGSGPVDVLYAGSLVDLMTKQVGPAFSSASGYSFTGFSGDSGSLATEIKGKVKQGDVYISANPTVNTKLEGTANGNWVSWYATFASSPLVIGYNPKSKFAADLKTKPWYQVLAEPGILIGRTDPATDPKGVLAVTALTAAATADTEPSLKTVATTTSNVYPEDTLVGRLQSGQLDVGFFYAAEAKAANIATVPVTGQTLAAHYTITVLNNAPHEAGAEAFVTYLLGSAAKPALDADGFTLVTPPTLTGTGVPSGLQSLLSGQ
jgi:molybdate/tungstate transport system substrate-binding protein